jgi:hypothetical protein
MAGHTSSLDDVLMGSMTNSTTPAPPEPAYEEQEVAPRETFAPEPESEVEEDIPEPTDDYGAAEEAPEAPPKQIDEYGNEKAAAKMFSEDEVNERINQAVRDRLSRFERNNSAPQPPTQAQATQAAQGFEYDSGSADSWQTQLEAFVEQTVSKMSQKQAYQSSQAREQMAQQEFESKFTQGMSKFTDFKDVVGSQPISDDMVRATRTMKDPAAFLYAAAKRAPQELQRISNLSDPYAQIAEIAKLEEKMKRTKPATSAPKPVSRTSGDRAVPHKSDRESSIEDMIANDAARRLALQKRRKG